MASKQTRKATGDLGSQPFLMEELDQVYQQIPVGLGVVDEKLRFIRINDRLASIDNLSPAAHAGRRIKEIVPESVTLVEKYCRQVLKTGKSVRNPVRDRKIRKDSVVDMYLHASYHPLVQARGKVVGVLMMVPDVSLSARGEEAFQKRLDFETLIADLSAKFVNVNAGRVKDEIEKTLEIIVHHFDIDRCGIEEFTEDRQSLFSRYSYALPGTLPYPRKVLNTELPHYVEVMRRGKIICCRKPEDLPEGYSEEKAYMEKVGIKSNLTIPIFIAGGIVCVISLDSFRTYRTWSDEIVFRIRILGEIFANAMLREKTDIKLKKSMSKIQQLKNEIEAERNYLREEIKYLHNFEYIIGRSPALKNTLYKVQQVAPTDTATLILGETGTGKELIARAIHSSSKRASQPLIKVNCAALPSNLIESELFGHEKGAFSGAHTKRVGRFEIAHGGTLFLDEIGELPLDLQAKLLRVLQEGEFERLGSSRTIKVDTRIIAATNRDLDKEARAGRFREDLWYRLNVYPITVPPLRDRGSDTTLLVNWFVKKFNKKHAKKITTITPKTIKTLEQYAWPGNVRELENIVERGVINSKGSVLNMSDKLGVAAAMDPAKMPLKKLSDMEKAYIIQALKSVKGRIYGRNGAAKMLGLHPETLRSKMRKHGIRKDAVSL